MSRHGRERLEALRLPCDYRLVDYNDSDMRKTSTGNLNRNFADTDEAWTDRSP
jgi:hypothetical protein